MDTSASSYSSLAESPFVFDQHVSYPQDLVTDISHTTKEHSIEFASPFRQDANLGLSQLRHLHKSGDIFLSAADSPSPTDMSGMDGGIGQSMGHVQQHYSDSTGTGYTDFLNSTNNSLGLVGTINPHSPHSHPSSRESMLKPAMLQRQHSFSNLSDTSGSSQYNDANSTASSSQFDPTSPTRSSFTPFQSPMGLNPSLSGLAIGTPQNNVFDLNQENGAPRHLSFQGARHDQLLSLGGPAHVMAPPAGAINRRRATGVAHSLYTSQLQQMREDQRDDTTPMPMSTQTFEGQFSQDVSSMTPQETSGLPSTPGRHSLSGMSSYQTPLSASATPDDSLHNSINSTFSAPRLRRMDSYDSAYSALSSPISEMGLLHGDFFQGNRTVEEAIAEQEAKHGRIASQPQQRQGGSAVQPSSSAMSRISSAPSMTPSGSEMGGQYSSSGTPNRSSTFLHQMQMSQDHQRKSSLPMTPNRGTSSHHDYNLTLSAPQMVSTRSLGSKQSPMNAMLSPMSLADMKDGSDSELTEGDFIRSPASGATRTLTPRSRIRGNVPPPLIVSSADKLHVCFCGKRFKRLEHLKRHNRVHTQERPHACPEPGCHKWFGRTDNLTQHLKTHYRTVGRSSENLLSITNAKASLMGQKGEARHDPHAAAAAAAAQAVSKTMKARRTTESNDILGGPISLSRPHSSSSSSPLTKQEESSTYSPMN